MFCRGWGGLESGNGSRVIGADVRPLLFKYPLGFPLLQQNNAPFQGLKCFTVHGFIV